MADKSTTIGARLVLYNSGQFIAQAKEATKAQLALNDAIKDGAVASKTSADSADAVAASTAKKTKVVQDSADAHSAEADALNAGAAASALKKQNDDDYVKTVNQATRAVKTHKSALESLSSSKIVSGIAKYGTIGIVGGAYEGIKQYQQFQTAVTQLSSQAGIAAKRLPDLSKGFMGISRETGNNLESVANQAYRIVSAGTGMKETNKQILQLVKLSAQLNVTGNVTNPSQQENTARVLGALTNVKKSGKITGAGSPTQIAGLINATAGAGDMRMSDLLGALGSGILPSLQSVGGNLTQTMGMIALATHFGAKPQTAANLLSHSIRQLANPTAQGTKWEGLFGIDPTALAKEVRGKGGITGAISTITKQVNKGLANNPNYPMTSYGGQEYAQGMPSEIATLKSAGLQMTPSFMSQIVSGNLSKENKSILDSFVSGKIFGNAKQGVPIIQAAENSKKLNAIIAEIQAKANPKNFNKDYALAAGSPGTQRTIAENQVKVMGAQLGGYLSPAFNTGLKGLADFADWLGSHQGVFKSLVAGLGGLVGLAVALKGISGAVKLYQEASSGIKAIGSAYKKFMGIDMKGFGSTSGTSGYVGAIDANTTALDRLTGSLDRYALEPGKEPLSPYGTVPGGEKPKPKPGEATAAGESDAGVAAGSEALGPLAAIAGAAWVGNQVYQQRKKNPNANPTSVFGPKGPLAFVPIVSKDLHLKSLADTFAKNFQDTLGTGKGGVAGTVAQGAEKLWDSIFGSHKATNPATSRNLPMLQSMETNVSAVMKQKGLTNSNKASLVNWDTSKISSSALSNAKQYKTDETKYQQMVSNGQGDSASAKTLQTSAQQHLTAAKQQLAAVTRFEAVVNQLQSKPLQATISQQAAAKALINAQSNKAARGAGGAH